MFKDILGQIVDVVDKRFLITSAIVVFCGIYLGILFFGENSIPTYFNLKSQKTELTNKIVELKNKIGRAHV